MVRGGWLAIVLLLLASPASAETRISQGEVLRHQVRQDILQALVENPGLSAEELASGTDLHASTVRYHLRALQRHDLISVCKRGRRLHYYAKGAANATHVRASAVLAQPPYRRLADVILSHPGIKQKGICQALGIFPSRAHDRTNVLIGTGLVEKFTAGREVMYVPTSLLRSQVLTSDDHGTTAAQAVASGP